MAGVTVSREIRAPIQVVFEVFTDLEHLTEHIEGIIESEVLTEGPVGPGTRWTETRKVMGKPHTEEMAIGEFELNKRYTVTAENCGTAYLSTLTFEEIDAGTRVTFAFVGKPLTFFAKLLSPMFFLMGGSLQKMMAADLDDLTKVAEVRTIPGADASG